MAKFNIHTVSYNLCRWLETWRVCPSEERALYLVYHRVGGSLYFNRDQRYGISSFFYFLWEGGLEALKRVVPGCRVLFSRYIYQHVTACMSSLTDLGIKTLIAEMSRLILCCVLKWRAPHNLCTQNILTLRHYMYVRGVILLIHTVAGVYFWDVG